MSLVLSDSQRDLLALHLVSGVGQQTLQQLIERFGSATAALRASADELEQVPHVGSKLAGAIARAESTDAVTAELEQIARHSVRLIFRDTPEYPESLSQIPDAPHVLYVRGQLQLTDAAAVAVVGSRHCSTYGRKITVKLVEGLVQARFTVISGLARGIDGEAHLAALAAGGRTVAVVAGGLTGIYPPEHAQLAEQIVGSGALVTESCMMQDPIAGLFHSRNRIISGMSRVVVIVEAAHKSGALITASRAGDQGRTVLAVPGPIDSATSSGCHDLIRKGAVLCRSVDDILEEIHGVSAMENATVSRPASPPPGLDETQQRIWHFLAEGPRAVDEMAQQLALAVAPLTTTLMMLEMRKVVRRLPGSRYERVR